MNNGMENTKENFKKAIQQLNEIRPITKMNLMIWRFGYDFQDIDGAIPQNIYNELLKVEDNPGFHYATDCSSWNYKVVDLYEQSDYIYTAILGYIKFFLACQEWMREHEKYYIDKELTIWKKYYRYIHILFPEERADI